VGALLVGALLVGALGLRLEILLVKVLSGRLTKYRISPSRSPAKSAGTPGVGR
jgi:hypothetical protein